MYAIKYNLHIEKLKSVGALHSVLLTVLDIIPKPIFTNQPISQCYLDLSNESQILTKKML